MSEAASSSVDTPVVVDVNIASELSVAKGRKLTSPVWSEFKKLTESNGVVMAVCDHCKKKFNGDSRSGTTHLKNHLARCPLRVNKIKGQLEIQTCLKDGETEILRLQNFKFDQETSRLDLAKMVIKHHYPFNLVEHELFSEFLSNLQPRFRLCSRNTLRSDVLKLYEIEKKKMYYVFENLSGRVSLTTDLWTCTTQKVAYCALTAHYIDNNWVLRKKVICFPKIESKHDGFSLFEILKKLLLEWNIEKKLFSLTVDNATSNDSMTKHLKTWLNSFNLLPLNGSLFHVRCAAHILNLIVQDGLKSIDGMLKKIRESVIYVNSSPQRKQQFALVLSQLKLHKSKQPGDDVPTRWNSTFLMLECAISLKSAYLRLSQVDSRYLLNPSDEEWDIGESVCNCLRIFYDATLKFSGVKYPTASIYFPIVCGIQKAIINFADNDESYVSDMSVSMKLKFDKYWSESNLLMCIGVILDPRFKLAFVEFYLNELYGIGSELQLSNVRTCLKNIFDEYELKSVNPNTSNSVNPSNSNVIISADVDESCMADFNKWYNESHGSSQVTQKTELERYLEESLVKGADFNLLAWWGENHHRFPTLGRIARDVLAVPISNVASESSFSIGGNIIEASRNALGPDVVQALMCGQDWLELPNGKVSRRGTRSGAPLHP